MNLVIVPEDRVVTHKFYNVTNIKNFSANSDDVSKIVNRICHTEVFENTYDADDVDVSNPEIIVHKTCRSFKPLPATEKETIDLTKKPDTSFNKYVCFESEGKIVVVEYDGVCYVTKPNSMTTVDKF